MAADIYLVAVISNATYFKFISNTVENLYW